MELVLEGVLGTLGGILELALEAVVVPAEVLVRMLVVVRVMLLQMTLWVLLLVMLKAVTLW